MELQHELAKQTVHIAVSKALNDIQTDTSRTIRNLIDLGLLFSRGETQKWFFRTARQIITTPGNSYKSLISRMVSDIDHETIKTFGTNLGYSVLTYGANKLKREQNLTGLKLPWFLIFDMSPDTGFGNSLSKIPEWINQGQELGIYGYGFSSFSETLLLELCEMLKQFRDCAFLLETPPSLITARNAACFREIHNTVIVVDTGDLELNGTECAAAFYNLKQNRCFYGCSSRCSDSTFDLFTSEQIITEAITLGNTFYILRPASPISFINRERLYRFICHERSCLGKPLVCFDWDRDTAFISEKLLAEGGCLPLSFASPFIQSFCRKNPFKGLSLKELLKMYPLTPSFEL